MAKAKDKEDNRDIFDKVFEYAVPTVGGALLGRTVGRRFGTLSKAQRKALEKQRTEESLRLLEGKKSRLNQVGEKLAEDSSARGSRGLFGATVGGATGAYYPTAVRVAKQEQEAKRRK